MKRLAFTLICILLSVAAFADEGMWMITHIDAALQKKMKERGLQLEAGEIYNADAPGASLSDAVVSLGFYCSGSMISDKGLLITNHHCAYGDIFALSTPEHNYLEKGYWAMKDSEEIPIPGKEVFFLKKVLDVTDEVIALREEQERLGRGTGMRRLSYLMEKKYTELTSLEASLHSMWAGTKYYIALYQVYRDLRLVAAPPATVAAFGGDIDNWEWPQHKCDFAMYRLYTAPDGSPAEYSPENVPMKPARKLEISLEGYNSGDFTMVIGYPGRTDRYSSSAKVDYKQNITMPITTVAGREKMDIIKRHMDADPEIRLKYSDYYFGLSNAGEMYEGQLQCLKRFGVIALKQQEEAKMQAWLESNPELYEKYGTVLSDMKQLYAETEQVEILKAYYRESMTRSTLIARTLSRLGNAKDSLSAQKKMIARDYAALDLRVEKDLLDYSVRTFIPAMDEYSLGDYHKELLAKFGADYQAISDYIWNNSIFNDPSCAERYTGKEMLQADPLYRYFSAIGVTTFNHRDDNFAKGQTISKLAAKYTKALYLYREAMGQAQYPDANSTMRITYGTVGALEPKDGVVCSWRTTQAGLVEKYDASSPDFCYDDAFAKALGEASWGRWAVQMPGKAPQMHVNFLTDNDITGGNSGSPVLDAKGRLIGLAFDGNKESLASDIHCVDGYNKCVCVDIRYVLWVLDRYAGLHRILDELGL